MASAADLTVSIDAREIEAALSELGPTLRDQIAIAAMATLIGFEDGGTVEDVANELGIRWGAWDYQTHWPLLVAKRAYRFADAMMAERRMV